MSEFGALRLIDAGVLNVGYTEVGPSDGPGSAPSQEWRVT